MYAVTVTYPAPWFTHELHCNKATSYQFEHISMKTGLTLPHKDYVLQHNEPLKKGKTDYYAMTKETPEVLFFYN